MVARRLYVSLAVVLGGMALTLIPESSADSAGGAISWPDGRRENVPSGSTAFFDRANYPALFT